MRMEMLILECAAGCFLAAIDSSISLLLRVGSIGEDVSETQGDIWVRWVGSGGEGLPSVRKYLSIRFGLHLSISPSNPIGNTAAS
jgi:hypothetical protein